MSATRPEPPETASPEAFRSLMSLFPSGVAVVTAREAGGTPRGVTCTSLASVSLDPPLLLVCLHALSGTLAALRRTGAFAVNLLHHRGRGAAEIFASPVTDRFARVEWAPGPDGGLPWLPQHAHAVAECEVWDSRAAGDHVVVFGSVRRVHTEPATPLLYGRRQYRSWAQIPIPDQQTERTRR
ncbi:flavin reductase family protein [Actinokineospora sp. 24-640]